MNFCGFCYRRIEEEPALYARGQLWHLQHFSCSDCGCRIQEGEEFEIREENSICRHCYIHSDAPQCAGCMTGIEGSFVGAAGRLFHASCFACAVCLRPLSNRFVENAGGLPMHTKCFWEYQLMIAIADQR